jgi:hypothetical protein
MIFYKFTYIFKNNNSGPDLAYTSFADARDKKNLCKDTLFSAASVRVVTGSLEQHINPSKTL